MLDDVVVWQSMVGSSQQHFIGLIVAWIWMGKGRVALLHAAGYGL